MIKDNRTKILLTIFIITSVLGGVFVYFYKQFGNELVARYVEKITNCGIILEEEVCSTKKFCEGIYAPSDPSSQQATFLKCQKIPLDRLAGIQQDFNLCENTGGMWYENKLGKFCICDKLGARGTFDKEKGCIAR